MKLLVKLLLIAGLAASSAWTMGCQRNDYDSDRTSGSIASRSAPATADNDDDADVNIDAPNPPSPPDVNIDTDD